MFVAAERASAAAVLICAVDEIYVKASQRTALWLGAVRVRSSLFFKFACAY